MSIDELKRIWEPKAQQEIKTWHQINPAWPKTELHLYGAGSDSGTFDYFTEAVVGKPKSSRGDYTASEDDNILVQGVANDVNALGYFGFAYYDSHKEKIRAIPIISQAGAPAILPSIASVKDGSYQPLSRPVFIYVAAQAAQNRPEVAAFVDFYLQHHEALAREIKFIPLADHEKAKVLNHWQAKKLGSMFQGKQAIGVKIDHLLDSVI